MLNAVILISIKVNSTHYSLIMGWGMHTPLTEGKSFLSLCLIKVWQVSYATDPDRLSFVLSFPPFGRPLSVFIYCRQGLKESLTNRYQREDQVNVDRQSTLLSVNKEGKGGVQGTIRLLGPYSHIPLNSTFRTNTTSAGKSPVHKKECL